MSAAFFRQGFTEVARIRLLLVDPKARGLGLGARLTDECIRFARSAGYKKDDAMDHSVLTAARHIYKKAGFKLMRSEQHQDWGPPVVSEHWDLELRATFVMAGACSGHHDYKCTALPGLRGLPGTRPGMTA